MTASSSAAPDFPDSVLDPAPGEFHQAMRAWTGGVCVITVGDGDGRNGLTATSLIPVSLDPPEVLISVNQAASSWPTLMASGRFGVSLLADSQRDVARRFAGVDGVRGAERYGNAGWRRGAAGVWLLEEALASFSCDVAHVWRHRHHALVVGRVLDLHLGPGAASPLAYWQGEYRQLACAPLR